MCIHTYIHIYIHTYLHLCLNLYLLDLHLYLYIYICIVRYRDIEIEIDTATGARECVSTVYVCICMYIHVYVCIGMYIHVSSSYMFRPHTCFVLIHVSSYVHSCFVLCTYRHRGEGMCRAPMYGASSSTNTGESGLRLSSASASRLSKAFCDGWAVAVAPSTDPRWLASASRSRIW